MIFAEFIENRFNRFYALRFFRKCSQGYMISGNEENGDMLNE